MSSAENTPPSDLNPYQAPRSSVEFKQNDGLVLASRWYRLFARIIDAILMLLLSMPFLYWLTGDWLGNAGAEQYDLFWSYNSLSSFVEYLIGIGVYVAVNTYLLATRGQTVGKYLLKIQIVDYYSEEIPKLRFSLVLREGILTLLNLFGFLGGLIALVDALFIFATDKRCLHDYWAFTKVVDIRDIQYTSYDES